MSYLKKYLEAEKKLKILRLANRGEESKEEEDLLDEMDSIWSKLSQEEMHILNAMKPKLPIQP